MASALPTTIQPTYIGTYKNFEARVLVTDFGDGYRQRVGDGINTIRRNYDIEWIGSNTDIDELETHFEERAGYQSFTWTPPEESTERKWTCMTWSREHMADGISRITASFRQEYDL